MTALADLQPDRRAVLQLLVARGRGYDQIAELLNLPEIVVRRRAHDAITALAGGDGGLDATRRALLCDYLVGELPASRRTEARKVLADDPVARRFARTAAGRLGAIDGAQLPELPPEDEEVVEALDALDKRRERKAELASSSRKGAWLLIGGLALAVIAVVVVLSLVAGGDNGDTTTNAGDTPGETTPATSDRPMFGVELKSPSGGAAKGEAALRESPEGAMNLVMNAEGLPPTRQLDGGRFTAYAFWLDGPDAEEPLRLGFFQPKDDANGVSAADGTLEMVVTLDGSTTPAVDAADLDKYRDLFITRETLESATDRPDAPGPIVLTGEIATITG